MESLSLKQKKLGEETKIEETPKTQRLEKISDLGQGSMIAKMLLFKEGPEIEEIIKLEDRPQHGEGPRLAEILHLGKISKFEPTDATVRRSRIMNLHFALWVLAWLQTLWLIFQRIHQIKKVP